MWTFLHRKHFPVWWAVLGPNGVARGREHRVSTAGAITCI